MSEYCVVVSDASRARFFTLESSAHPKVESGPRLVEQEAIVNPESAIRDADLFSQTGTGSNRTKSGPSHRYDDHRTHHHQELARRFTRLIVRHTDRLCRDTSAENLVVVAENQMLGLIRQEEKRPAGVNVRHLARDLTKMSPKDIQHHLAGEGLVPACEPPLRMPGERH